jgi:hypothetical protein
VTPFIAPGATGTPLTEFQQWSLQQSSLPAASPNLTQTTFQVASSVPCVDSAPRPVGSTAGLDEAVLPAQALGHVPSIDEMLTLTGGADSRPSSLMAVQAGAVDEGWGPGEYAYLLANGKPYSASGKPYLNTGANLLPSSLGEAANIAADKAAQGADAMKQGAVAVKQGAQQLAEGVQSGAQQVVQAVDEVTEGIEPLPALPLPQLLEVIAASGDVFRTGSRNLVCSAQETIPEVRAQVRAFINFLQEAFPLLSRKAQQLGHNATVALQQAQQGIVDTVHRVEATVQPIALQARDSALHAGQVVGQEAQYVKQVVTRKAVGAKDAATSAAINAGQAVKGTAIAAKDATANAAIAAKDSAIGAGQVVADKAVAAKNAVAGAGQALVEEAVVARNAAGHMAAQTRDSVVLRSKTVKDNTLQELLQKTANLRQRSITSAGSDIAQSMIADSRRPFQRRVVPVMQSQPAVTTQQTIQTESWKVGDSAPHPDESLPQLALRQQREPSPLHGAHAVSVPVGSGVLHGQPSIAAQATTLGSAALPLGSTATPGLAALREASGIDTLQKPLF